MRFRASVPLVVCSVLVASLLMSGPVTADEICGSSAVTGGEWSVYGQNLSGTREQPSETMIGADDVDELEVQWAVAALAPEQMRGTATVAGGCVYTASWGPGPGLGSSATGTIYAIDAHTGDVVWEKHVVDGPTTVPGIFAPTVVDGVLYAVVSQTPVPYVLALDAVTGAEIWTSYLYHPIADGEVVDVLNASPVVFDGLLFVPFGGFDSWNFSHPSYFILDVTDGSVVHKEVVIPQDQWLDGYAGGGIWTTPVIDPEGKALYVGTANPYNKRREHERTNSLMKIDMDRDSDTFGAIVANYKGDVDYDPVAYNSFECETFGELQVVGFSYFCGQDDVDFGSSLNMWRTSEGRLLVGALQKSGTFHAVDAVTMEPVWAARELADRAAGGNAATSAVDADAIYVGVDNGVLYALDRDTGERKWTTTYADIGGKYQPLTVANGVVYTLGNDAKLYAFDTETGVELLAMPLEHDGTRCNGIFGGGISISNNTLFAVCDATGLETPVPPIAAAAVQPGAVFAIRL